VELQELTAKKGRFQVRALLLPLGDDFLVVLCGGKAHIGAVGMAEPRPSLRDPSQRSATGSVFTFLGHKEDVVAKALAEELSRGLGCRVVVVAGMHWEGLTEAEIEEVLELCKEIARKILLRIGPQPPSTRGERINSAPSSRE